MIAIGFQNNKVFVLRWIAAGKVERLNQPNEAVCLL
jgi:hypothetical protein